MVMDMIVRLGLELWRRYCVSVRGSQEASAQLHTSAGASATWEESVVTQPLPQGIKDFITAARVCRIATVRPNGEPHVIPVCPVFDGDSTVYVDIGPRSATAGSIESDPRVAVVIDEYSEDWNELKSVLLRCRAEPVDSAERDRAWDRIREKFPQYEGIGWEPRLTLALRVYDWRQAGVVKTDATA
jgi:general stress protein 26